MWLALGCRFRRRLWHSGVGVSCLGSIGSRGLLLDRCHDFGLQGSGMSLGPKTLNGLHVFLLCGFSSYSPNEDYSIVLLGAVRGL